MGTVLIAPYAHAYFDKAVNDGVGWTQIRFRQSAKQSVLRPLNPAHTLSLTTEVVHVTPDSTNVVGSPDADSSGKAHTLLNEMQTKLNLHFLDAASHLVADDVNVIEADEATNIATAVAMANECYLDLLAHMLAEGVHFIPDLTELEGVLAVVPVTPPPQGPPQSPDPYVTVYALGNLTKAAYNVHRVLCAEAWELAAAGVPITWSCGQAVWVQLSANGSLSVRTHV